ncbi:putative endonuclease [Klebsiella phage RCIP0091]|jgi:Zn finger protein HypA/HybF involved in hydrogenase expression
MIKPPSVSQITERLNGRKIRILEYGGTMMTKSTFECEKCGYVWSTTCSSVITGNHGCRRCVGKSSLSKDEIIGKISNRGITLVDYSGKMHSKSTFRCDKCHHEWVTQTRHVVYGCGCPRCNVLNFDSVSERLVGRKITLLTFGGGSTVKSEFKCNECDNVWQTKLNTVLNGSGCPRCANHGYDTSKPGTLYVFKSTENNWLKVGITNKFNQRKSQLIKRTPFGIDLVARWDSEDGSKILKMEKYIHKTFKTANASVKYGRFTGYTEWLIYDDEIIQIVTNL